MVLEICTDTVDGAIAAGQLGAKRVELCSALSIGGLTPNFGLIRQCVKRSSAEIHVMIRHKEGDFQYDSEDVGLMKVDIEQVAKIGAHGVVFGILNSDNKVSVFNDELVRYAKSFGLEVTFHRAFDFTSNYHEAIQKIIAYGFDRLLTSGLKSTALEGLEIITELQASYGKQIQIMAGSGVCLENALIIAGSGVDNIHFTAKRVKKNITGLSMGKNYEVDAAKIKGIRQLFN